MRSILRAWFFISLFHSQTYRGTPFGADEIKDVGLVPVYSSCNISYVGMRLPTDVARDVFHTLH